jgi:hypothetical protein
MLNGTDTKPVKGKKSILSRRPPDPGVGFGGHPSNHEAWIEKNLSLHKLTDLSESDQARIADSQKIVNEWKAGIAERDAAVEAVGKQVTLLADKIKRETDKAVDVFNKHIGENLTFREALAAKLKEAAPLCKAAGMTNKDFKAKYVGDRLAITQFKQILGVARGYITFEEIKKKETDRKRKTRAAKAADAETEHHAGAAS